MPLAVNEELRRSADAYVTNCRRKIRRRNYLKKTTA